MPDSNLWGGRAALVAAMLFAAPAAAEGLKDLNKAPDLFAAATSGGNADGIAAFYAPNALLLAPGSPVVRGRDAIRALYARNQQAGRNTLRFTDFSVDAGADRAVILWAWTLTVEQTGGGRGETRGRSLLFLKNAGGTWYIVADMFQPTP